MDQLLFRPARFAGFVCAPERELDTKSFSDRGGAISRARVLQQTYTKITIIQRSDNTWQVRYSQPLPTASSYPFDDNLPRDTPAGADRRARVLRAYGYVVTRKKRASDYICSITKLVGSKPALPTAIGIDVGFYYDRKDSAQRRADALAEVGFGVTVFERTDKNWQVKITKLPTFPAPAATSTTTTTKTPSPAPASTSSSKLERIIPGDVHKLSKAVVQSFRDFAIEVEGLTNVSLLKEFGDTVRGLDTKGKASKSSDSFTWHKTGRAVDIDQHPKWVMQKETDADGDKFRLYLLHKDKKATVGVKRFPKGTTFYKAYWSDVPASWAFVDITAIAARHGWTRIPAQKGYGLRGNKPYNKLEFWHYEKRDGLTWRDAMLQLYTDTELTRAMKKLASASPNRYAERLRNREGFDDAAMAAIFPLVKKGNLELRCSVGKKGANLASDVRAVQNALEKQGSLAAASNTGTMNAATETAIKAFQRTLGQSNPDGSIGVGLDTHKGLGKI